MNRDKFELIMSKRESPAAHQAEANGEAKIKGILKLNIIDTIDDAEQPELQIPKVKKVRFAQNIQDLEVERKICFKHQRRASIPNLPSSSRNVRPPPEGILFSTNILAGALVTSVLHENGIESQEEEISSFYKGVHAMVDALHEQYKVKVQEGPQSFEKWIQDVLKPFVETKEKRTLDVIVTDAQKIVDEMMEKERSENSQGKDIESGGGGSLNDEQGKKEETVLEFLKTVMDTKLTRKHRHSLAMFLVESLK